MVFANYSGLIQILQTLQKKLQKIIFNSYDVKH